MAASWWLECLLRVSGGKRARLDHLMTRRRHWQRVRGTCGGGNVTTIPRPFLGFAGRTGRVPFSTRGGQGVRWKNVDTSTSLAVSRPLPILIKDANADQFLLNHGSCK